MPEPGVGNAPERDGFGGRDTGGGGRAGGVGTPGVGGGFAPRDFNQNFTRDRDIASRFQSTFGGGFLADTLSRFQPPTTSRNDILKAMLLGGPAGLLGLGLGRAGQALFTRNPDGTRGFTPPGGSAAAAEARGAERDDPKARLGPNVGQPGRVGLGNRELPPFIQQLLGGGTFGDLRSRFQGGQQTDSQRIAALMEQLQRSLSP